MNNKKNLNKFDYLLYTLNTTIQLKHCLAPINQSLYIFICILTFCQVLCRPESTMITLACFYWLNQSENTQLHNHFQHTGPECV
jgi:hypothetical protein